MAQLKKALQVVLAVVIGLGAPGPVYGQVIMEGPTAFDNINLSLGNPPGDMVNAGIARAKDAAQQGRAQVTQPDITETTPTMSIGDQFMSDVADIFLTAVEDLVNQFVQALLSIVTGWLSNAGLVPDTSSLGDLLPSNGTDGTTTDGQTDTGTNTTGTDGTGTTDMTNGTSTDGSATTDSGVTDGGTTDSGATDSGTADSGTTDSGTTDSGTTDSSTAGRTGRSGRR